MEKKTCPKCNGEMAPGRRRDLSVARSAQEMWLEWDAHDMTGRTTGGGGPHPVMTFACQSCGYLESYLCDKLL
jgi:hypothetical protein